MLYYTLKRLADTEKLVSKKSKGLLTEKLTIPTTSGNSTSPSINWYRDSKVSCLKQKNTTYTPPNKKDFFFFYKLDTGHDI